MNNVHVFSNADPSFGNCFSASVFQKTERCWLLPAHTCTRMWTIHQILCQRTRFTSDTCQTKKQSPNRTTRTKHIFRKQTIQKLHFGFNSTLILGHLFDTFSFSFCWVTRDHITCGRVCFSLIKVADKKKSFNVGLNVKIHHQRGYWTLLFSIWWRLQRDHTLTIYENRIKPSSIFNKCV